MTLGYHTQLEPGILGTSPSTSDAFDYPAPFDQMGPFDGPLAFQTDSDPFRQAALQEAVFQQNQAVKEAAVAAGLYVPPGMGYGPSAPEWATQPGLGNLPKIGWTVQQPIISPATTNDQYDFSAPYDEASSYDGPSRIPVS